MIDPELNDKLMQTFETCEIHLKRMEFASSKMEGIIPLTPDTYNKMDDEAVNFIDQYIFRFSKLQDIIGGRMFPLTLEALAEPVAGKPFIDILNRLEKLEVIDSALSWIQLRKIRNDVTHEYPALISEKIEGINLLFENLGVIKMIIFRCRSILDKHGL
jgi:hypothetical protein